MNPATLIDGYKTSHHLQYPEGTEVIVSNFTARKTRRSNVNKVVFFGLQYFIKKYLIQEWNEKFFQKPLEEVLKSKHEHKELYSHLIKEEIRSRRNEV